MLFSSPSWECWLSVQLIDRCSHWNNASMTHRPNLRQCTAAVDHIAAHLVEYYSILPIDYRSSAESGKEKEIFNRELIKIHFRARNYLVAIIINLYKRLSSCHIISRDTHTKIDRGFKISMIFACKTEISGIKALNSARSLQQ